MATRGCILIGGGARSGKSAFALRRARQLGARRVCVATAQPVDDEMRGRIARHRQDRGGDFRTIEEATQLAEVLGALADIDVVVVDCLTVWLSNLLVGGADEAAVLSRVDTLVDTLTAAAFYTVLVSNEVGMSVHPESALGRTFRDLVGRAHQQLARRADEIYFAALGVIVRLRPAPVEIVTV